MKGADKDCLVGSASSLAVGDRIANIGTVERLVHTGVFVEVAYVWTRWSTIDGKGHQTYEQRTFHSADIVVTELGPR